MPNELDAIKSELRHFERQWEKTDFHAEQLDELELAHQTFGNGESGDDYTHSLREQQEKLQRKLKKLEVYLEDKLTAAHHS